MTNKSSNHVAESCRFSSKSHQFVVGLELQARGVRTCFFLFTMKNNVTLMDDIPINPMDFVIKSLLLFVLAILSLVANLVAFLTIISGHYGQRRQPKSMNALLLNLVVSDICVATFCTLGNAIWNLTFQWYGGDIGCRIFKFAQQMSLHSSTFLITAISCDRVLTVLLPLRSYGARRRQLVMIVLAWLLSAATAGPAVSDFLTLRLK